MNEIKVQAASGVVDAVRKDGEVFRVPVYDEEAWQVFWQGRVLSPWFNSPGAAQAYLDGMRKGRKPY